VKYNLVFQQQLKTGPAVQKMLQIFVRRFFDALYGLCQLIVQW